MLKKIAIYTATTLIIVLAAALAYFSINPLVIVVSEEKVQELAAQYIPESVPLEGDLPLGYTYSAMVTGISVDTRSAEVPLASGDITATALNFEVTTGFVAGGLPDIRNNKVYPTIDADQVKLPGFKVGVNETTKKSYLEKGGEFIASFRKSDDDTSDNSGSSKGLFGKGTDLIARFGEEEATTADKVVEKFKANALDQAKDLAVVAADKVGISEKELGIYLTEEFKKKLPGLLEKYVSQIPLYSLDDLGIAGTLLGATYQGTTLVDGDVHIAFTAIGFWKMIAMWALIILFALAMWYSGLWPLLAFVQH